jgi:hypothetical protein
MTRTAVTSLAPTPTPRQSVYWYYSSENLSPLVTPQFLARQRGLLLPAQYAREHENRWVDAADSFTTAVEVDAAMGRGWIEPIVGDPGVQYVQAWDIGYVHDPTVGVVGHLDADGVVIIDKIVTLQGSHDAPVQLATVEACIRDLAARFPCWRIRIESWQGISAAQSLTALGLPVDLVTPTAKLNSEEWPVRAHGSPGSRATASATRRWSLRCTSNWPRSGASAHMS